MSRAVLKLEDAGFDRRQVEALIDFIDGDRVTKADLLATEAKLERRIDQVESKLAALETKFEGKFTLLQWMFTALIAVNVGIFIKLLFD